MENLYPVNPLKLYVVNKDPVSPLKNDYTVPFNYLFKEDLKLNHYTHLLDV